MHDTLVDVVQVGMQHTHVVISYILNIGQMDHGCLVANLLLVVVRCLWNFFLAGSLKHTLVLMEIQPHIPSCPFHWTMKCPWFNKLHFVPSSCYHKFLQKFATYIATKCNYAQSSLRLRVSHRLPFFHPTYVVVFSKDLPRFLFLLDGVVRYSFWHCC